MNREAFRKLVGNEIVNVNSKYKGATAGKQGQIKSIAKRTGIVKVDFQGRKTPATYNYKFLDIVEEETHEEITKEKEEPITVPKMETTVDESAEQATEESNTEAPEVEEKDEASTSTETGS